jgi:hypothetical protein
LGDGSFTVLHVNCRGWRYNEPALSAQISLMHQRPSLVCVNETWLDDSVAFVLLAGYRLVSRRDRRDGRSGGGVAVFVAEEYEGMAVE